jgi:hypothetical protein
VVIGRYAARWPIEVGIVLQDARQVFGAGQARNRLAAACTAPSRSPGLPEHRDPLYATAGYYADVTEHRAPRYPDQGRAINRRHDCQAPPRPHRREISASSPAEPTLAEIHTVQLAWEGTAA